jgi:hypothetical protein
MNKFSLAHALRHLTSLQIQVGVFENALRTVGSTQHHPEVTKKAVAEIEDAADYAERHQFRDCWLTLLGIREHLRSFAVVDTSSLSTSVAFARNALEQALCLQTYLEVPGAYATYVDNPELFGATVHAAFPAARDDIREAGNCLAADCGTAAVFHLMRAVEWGLRALAEDLGLRRLITHKRSGAVKYVPLPWADWEHILNQVQIRVDKKIDRMRPGPRKQELQEFYGPALQDIRAIKDAWRNHVMHTRRAYTAKDAEGILDHVKRLLVSLAAKLVVEPTSEGGA